MTGIEPIIPILKPLFDIFLSIKQGQDMKKLRLEIEKNNIKLDKLTNDILFFKNNITLHNTNSSTQIANIDLRETKQLLQPIQNHLGQPIIADALMKTPKAMQQAFLKSPSDVLFDIKPLASVNNHYDNNLIPIVFQESNNHYIGWQKKGVLPLMFGFEYKDDSGLIVPENYNKSQSIELFESILGFKRGDCIKDVEAIFGVPGEDDSGTDSYIDDSDYGYHAVIYYHYDLIFSEYGGYAITFSFNKKTKRICVIEITRNLFMSDYYYKLEKFNDGIIYLNMHKDAIINTFGRPERTSESGVFFNYRTEMLSVEFRCENSERMLCHSINIHWFN